MPTQVNPDETATRKTPVRDLVQENRDLLLQGKKRCCRCRRIKNVGEFYLHKRLLRYRPECRECSVAANNKARTPEYRAWMKMRLRCNDPEHPQYRNYGGRGIKVCDEWSDSFDAFLSHVGPRPSPSHSIDRYPNNNGSYEPGNVRWATKIQQAQNMRANVLVEFNGRRMCVAAWAREFRMSWNCMRQRLKRWPLERALTEPKGTRCGRPKRS